MADKFTANTEASQNFVPIKEIRDGVAILEDGSLRTVIMASSVNFALKSKDEQTSIIYQFQNFLNSLNFSVQIVIQSRKFDVRPYIVLLQERQKEQTNDLLKIQTKEYIDFIKSFTEQYDIMTKNFFIVVPYTPATVSVSSGMFGMFGKKNKDNKKAERFEQARTQAEQRVSIVQQGLMRCGVRVIQLGTDELIEVYYRLFNPGSVEKPMKTS